MKLKLTLQQDQITGFSYSFAKALLDRLNNLYKQNKLYTLWSDEGQPKQLTILAQNLVNYLKEQIPCVEWGSLSFNERWDLEEKDELIKTYRASIEAVLADAYDFLATFEIKK